MTTTITRKSRMTKQREEGPSEGQRGDRAIKVRDETWESMSIESTRRRISLVELVEDMWAAYDKLPIRDRGWVLRRLEQNEDTPENLAQVLYDIACNPRPGEEILSELMIKHARRR